MSHGDGLRLIFFIVVFESLVRHCPHTHQSVKCFFFRTVSHCLVTLRSKGRSFPVCFMPDDEGVSGIVVFAAEFEELTIVVFRVSFG